MASWVGPEVTSVLVFRFGTFAKPKQEVEIRKIVKQPSLVRIILKTCGWQATEAAMLKLVNDVLLFVEPFVVKYVTFGLMLPTAFQYSLCF